MCAEARRTGGLIPALVLPRVVDGGRLVTLVARRLAVGEHPVAVVVTLADGRPVRALLGVRRVAARVCTQYRKP